MMVYFLWLVNGENNAWLGHDLSFPQQQQQTPTAKTRKVQRAKSKNK
jgi:hypothetical protein